MSLHQGRYHRESWRAHLYFNQCYVVCYTIFTCEVVWGYYNGRPCFFSGVAALLHWALLYCPQDSICPSALSCIRLLPGTFTAGAICIRPVVKAMTREDKCLPKFWRKFCETYCMPTQFVENRSKNIWASPTFVLLHCAFPSWKSYLRACVQNVQRVISCQGKSAKCTKN